MHVTGIATGNLIKKRRKRRKDLWCSTRSASYVYACLQIAKNNGICSYVKAIDDVALGADTYQHESWFYDWFYDQCDSDIVDAIKRARAKGVSVLISAGNSAIALEMVTQDLLLKNPDYGLVGNPSNSRGLISVASINNNVITTEVFEVKGSEGNAEADNGKFDYSN